MNISKSWQAVHTGLWNHRHTGTVPARYRRLWGFALCLNPLFCFSQLWWWSRGFRVPRISGAFSPVRFLCLPFCQCPRAVRATGCVAFAVPLTDVRLLRLARGQLSFPQRGAIERSQHKSLRLSQSPPPPLYFPSFSDDAQAPKAPRPPSGRSPFWFSPYAHADGVTSIRPSAYIWKLKFALSGSGRLAGSKLPPASLKLRRPLLLSPSPL